MSSFPVRYITRTASSEITKTIDSTVINAMPDSEPCRRARRNRARSPAAVIPMHLPPKSPTRLLVTEEHVRRERAGLRAQRRRDRHGDAVRVAGVCHGQGIGRNGVVVVG